MTSISLAVALVLSAAADAQPDQGAPGPAEAPAPQAGPTLLAGAADVRRVCEAAALPEGWSLPASPLEGAEAEARRASERDGALAARYRAEFPGDRVRFGAWNAEERVLSVQRHAPLLGGGGALRLHAVADDALPVTADAATVRRLLAAQREGKLALGVTFTLDDEDAPCFHVPGAPAWTVSAAPVAWEYRAGDEVLARGGEGADRAAVSAKAGARPRVELGAAIDDAGGKELRGAALGRLEGLQGCYGAALERDPFVDGAIVADVGRDRPAAERVRIAADSTNDAALVACVRDVLGKVDLRGAGRGFLPIHFVLEPPAAAAN